MLVDTAEGEWKLLILFAYFTGARLSDCCRMQWDGVDLAGETLTYMQAKTGAKVTAPLHLDLLERQKTVVTVVTMAGRAFLPVRHPIIRAVEVEDQLGGRRAARGDELIHQNPLQRPGGGAIRAFFHESLACAALTMMVEPNSRRMERAVPWTDRSVPAHRGFW
jgi:integrase